MTMIMTLLTRTTALAIQGFIAPPVFQRAGSLVRHGPALSFDTDDHEVGIGIPDSEGHGARVDDSSCR
jgi:hypothetical protein